MTRAILYLLATTVLMWLGFWSYDTIAGHFYSDHEPWRGYWWEIPLLFTHFVVFAPPILVLALLSLKPMQK